MKAENEAYLARIEAEHEEAAVIRARVVEALDNAGVVVSSVVVDTQNIMGDPLDHPAIEVRGSIRALGSDA